MYILDIETRADEKLLPVFLETARPPKNIKDPEKIAEWQAKKEQDASKLMAVDPDYNTIVCIGVKERKKDPEILTPKQFERWIGTPKHETDVMVTFNGKEFDLPVLIKYGLKNHFNFPFKRFSEGMRKWGKYGGHIDLMEVISAGREFRSLDTYLRVYCGVGKETMGDDFFRNATDDDLKKHCAEDLIYTETLLDVFLPLIV